MLSLGNHDDLCPCIAAEAGDVEHDVGAVVCKGNVCHLPRWADFSSKIIIRAAHDPVDVPLFGQGDGRAAQGRQIKGIGCNHLRGEAPAPELLLWLADMDLLERIKILQPGDLHLSLLGRGGGEADSNSKGCVHLVEAPDSDMGLLQPLPQDSSLSGKRIVWLQLLAHLPPGFLGGWIAFLAIAAGGDGGVYSDMRMLGLYAACPLTPAEQVWRRCFIIAGHQIFADHQRGMVRAGSGKGDVLPYPGRAGVCNGKNGGDGAADIPGSLDRGLAASLYSAAGCSRKIFPKIMLFVGVGAGIARSPAE